MADLSPRPTLETHSLEDDRALARELGIDKAPALAVIGAKDYGIRFFGVTEGYEFDSLIEAIERVASGRSGLPQRLEEWISHIDRPLHLEVMVTLTCPYCPPMVRLAHQLTIANDRIRADMVDAAEFSPTRPTLRRVPAQPVLPPPSTRPARA